MCLIKCINLPINQCINEIEMNKDELKFSIIFSICFLKLVQQVYNNTYKLNYRHM